MVGWTLFLLVNDTVVSDCLHVLVVVVPFKAGFSLH